MAKSAKITGYKSELVAVGTIDGSDAIIRIPVNVDKPTPGSVVAVRLHPLKEVTVLLGDDGAKNSDKKQTKVPLWLYDPALADSVTAKK